MARREIAIHYPAEDRYSSKQWLRNRSINPAASQPRLVRAAWTAGSDIMRSREDSLPHLSTAAGRLASDAAPVISGGYPRERAAERATRRARPLWRANAMH